MKVRNITLLASGYSFLALFLEAQEAFTDCPHTFVPFFDGEFSGEKSSKLLFGLPLAAFAWVTLPYFFEHIGYHNRMLKLRGVFPRAISFIGYRYMVLVTVSSEPTSRAEGINLAYSVFAKQKNLARLLDVF
jgi:hypothetical protein